MGRLCSLPDMQAGSCRVVVKTNEPRKTEVPMTRDIE